MQFKTIDVIWNIVVLFLIFSNPVLGQYYDAPNVIPPVQSYPSSYYPSVQAIAPYSELGNSYNGFSNVPLQNYPAPIYALQPNAFTTISPQPSNGQSTLVQPSTGSSPSLNPPSNAPASSANPASNVGTKPNRSNLAKGSAFSASSVTPNVRTITNQPMPEAAAGTLTRNLPVNSKNDLEKVRPEDQALRFKKNEPALPTLLEPTKPVDQIQNANSPTTNLAKLIEIQAKIDNLLPRLSPTVVAIEGGSGVIISPQGHILTVSHVAKKANRSVIVRMSNGRAVPAVTLGTNVNTDTAALKLVGNGPWPFVSIQELPEVEKGDWCLALGYPLSFKRGQPGALRIGRVLQSGTNRIITDCPIMGGDSGGPLFDLDGNLIGISSRVKTDINQNIHVRITKYQDDWSQLAASVDVPKFKLSSKPSYLGITGETDFGRVRIKQVFPGSPAERAGLLENDVIIVFGEKGISRFDDVVNVLRNREPGDEVVAQLNRYGSIINVPIRLGTAGGG